MGDSDDEHVDAVTTKAAWPFDRVYLGGICVIEPDPHAEIKSAAVRLASGQRGRFYVRQKQHEKLLLDGSVYLFTIYSPSSYDVLCLAGVSATIVDRRLYT